MCTPRMGMPKSIPSPKHKTPLSIGPVVPTHPTVSFANSNKASHM